MRQMRDLLVGARALGDVFDGGDPPAALQRPVDDLDRPAARRFRELTRGLAERYVVDDRVAEFIDVAVKGSGFLAVRDQPLHGAALFDHLRRQSEHLDIGLVADDDPRRCVIENKALRDIVHGDRELAPLAPPAAGSDNRWRLSSRPTIDGEDGDNRKQYAFAQAPGRQFAAIATRGSPPRAATGAKGRAIRPSRPFQPDSQNRPATDSRYRYSPGALPARATLRRTDGRRVTTCG